MEEKAAQKVSVTEIESLLCQLPGILSTRVVVNDWGAVEEVHVLATTERTAKQVVRDVESSLAAKWGLNIDHKKISVAQVEEKKDEPRPTRLKLVGMQVRTDTGNVRLRVQVSLEDSEGNAYAGEAQGPNSQTASMRAAADAVVQALTKAAGPGAGFVLEDVALISMRDYKVVVAMVTLLDSRGNEQVLTGSCIADVDLVEAAARATLDATNRRLQKLMQNRRDG